MRSIAVAALAAIGLGVAAPGATAQAGAPPPAGMSFVARDSAGAWALYRVDERRAVQRVATQLEPRQACLTANGSKGVYAAADGTLRLLDTGRETVLAKPDGKRAFTQPCMSADGRDVVAVEMADGKSIDTEILKFTIGSSRPAVNVARQPGAQHDPFLHQGRWLVYANVHCSDGCDRLIVEIWQRDLVAAEARQLTLLNALSQGPVTDGRRVVFSSNATGTFQLWQVGLDGTGLRRLTEGAAQATQPALCGGEIFFVRAGPQGSGVARLDADGKAAEVPLPGLNSVRALRCLQ